MRKYYVRGGARIYSLDTFGRWAVLPAQLNRRIAHFVKKNCYWWYSNLYMRYYKPLFGDQLGLGMFYFYEENNIAYEFFTGIEIGRVSQRSEYRGREVVSIKGEYLCDFLCTDADTEWMTQAYPITESQFAYDIKSYIPYRNRISALIRECLEIRHDMWAFYRDQENKRKEQEDLRNNYDASFLKDI